MTRAAAATMIAGLMAVLAFSPAQAAPRPSEVPVSWEIEIHLETPQAIEVAVSGEGGVKRFWYLRFTVTNQTGEDRIFVPECTLYTDTGQILRAGQNVPTTVFKAVQKLYNDPLLTDLTGVTGKLLQGEDNAKTGVAIWPDFDPTAGMIDIFIGGLSGETAQVQLPTPIQVTEMDAKGDLRVVEKDKAILSKTLQRSYGIPGEAAARLLTKAKLLREDWVMR